MDSKQYPNKKYQDTVFHKLFSTKEAVLELFNALEGTDYTEDTKIEITTLDNVLYLERKNDLGFTIASSFIFLGEQQSTINPNMPLRFLSYITYSYEKLIAQKSIYSRKKLLLPTPIFYVFYTGDAPWDTKTLKLSDCYMETPPENSLELVVKIINLRYNKDNEILKRSKNLAGYSMLITRIKDGLKEGIPLETSIQRAIQSCMEDGYLTAFLQQYGEEIGKMKFYEFSQKEYEDLLAEESFEAGMEKGLEKGMEAGIEKGLKKGLEAGIEALISDNLDEGVPEDRILDKLMRRFSLDKAQAQHYLEELKTNH